MSTSLIGATIGNYRVERLLGEGGMGAVYLAEHPLIGKKVALKVLHERFAGDPAAVARFFGEARAVNEIGHPNIVDVIDFGESAGGLVYLIMEYLPGESLGAVLKREGRLSIERAAGIAEQIADALGASHARGITHRDLKPDNVFLIQRGGHEIVKVLDFGIAKLSGASVTGPSTKTLAGTIMGTPAYMSPEQCEGAGRVDGRSDIYALGCVLFEMLCGRPPFVSDGWGELLVQQLTSNPPAPSSMRRDCPAELERIVLRCLEKEPGARFQTMNDLRAALRDPAGWSAGEPARLPSAPPYGPTMISGPIDIVRPSRPTTLTAAAAEKRLTTRPPVPSVERRYRAGIAVGVICALVAIGIAIFAAVEPLKTERPARRPATPMAPAETPAPDVAPVPKVVPQVRETETPALAPTVTLTVTTTPGARVFIDGRDVGPASAPITLPRSDEPVKLAIKAPGYKTFTRELTPSIDLSLDAPLVKRRRITTTESTCPADDPDCVLAPR